MKPVQINVRLPKPLLVEVKQTLKKTGSTMTWLLATLLQSWLSQKGAK